MRLPCEQHRLPSSEELRDASETLSGLLLPGEQFTARLQFVTDLIVDAGQLPTQPLLAWRDSARSVRHAIVGRELAVGRSPGRQGLSFPNDKLLSRRHFVIRAEGHALLVEDLRSHNGTAINHMQNRIGRRLLHDGDFLFAGSQVFVFLDQARTE
jgi:hypothetical protein